MVKQYKWGPLLENFSGLPPEVMQACEKLAQLRYGDVVNLRCQRLGEQLKLAKSLQGEGLEIKEGYDDHTLADDIELALTWWVTAQLH